MCARLSALALVVLAHSVFGGTVTYSVESSTGITDPTVVTFSDGNAHVTLSSDRTSALSLSIPGLDIAAPANTALISPTSHSAAPVCYERAQHFPPLDVNRPSLSFVHDFMGCSTVSGRFRIWDLTLNPANGALISAAIDFAQHCDGESAVTRGALRINSNQPADLTLIDPVFDVSGSFGFISTGWDYIGQGQDFSSTFDRYHASGKTFADNTVSFQGSTGAGWTINFANADHLPLTTGNFPNAQEYPVQTSGRPGFSFGYSDRGCNTITGGFAISSVEFDRIDGAPTGFDATFDQSCESFGAPLLGTLEFRQDFQNGPNVADVIAHGNFDETQQWPLVWRCDYR